MPSGSEESWPTQRWSAVVTALLDAFDEQIRHRLDGALPRSTYAERWGLTREGFHSEQDGSAQAVFALSDGVIGSSGAPLGDAPGANRRVLAAGVYTGEGPDTHLLSWPDRVAPSERHARGRGTSEECSTFEPACSTRSSTSAGRSYRSVRFSSLARPGTTVLRAQLSEILPDARSAAAVRGRGRRRRRGRTQTNWMRTWVITGGDRRRRRSATARIRDATGVVASTASLPITRTPNDAARIRRSQSIACERAARVGFDGLLNEHRRAWSRRWEDADVVIEGDDELQTRDALRAVPSDGVGRRSRRGGGRRPRAQRTGYRGHVFWDADTFVLPFLAATHPPRRAAMLEYRIRRLPVAIGGRAAGRAAHGARFPWESAPSGEDVTPMSARDRTGRVVPIRTGQLEEHIVAEVAWAACCYADWTGDDELRAGTRASGFSSRPLGTGRHGRASNPTARAHIYGVIGPDEYHEPVDDNAFTNVMARWNLRRALAALQRADAAARRERGRAAALARSRRRARRRLRRRTPASTSSSPASIELEPLLIAEVAPRRPIAADLLARAGARPRSTGRSSRPTCSCSTTSCPRRWCPRASSRTSATTSRAPRTAARCRPRFTPRCSPEHATSTGLSMRSGSPSAHRPRRPHRNDRRRSAPRDDGRTLAGLRVRVRRAARARWRAPHRSSAPARVAQPRAPGPLSWKLGSGFASSRRASKWRPTAHRRRGRRRDGPSSGR